MKRAIMIHRIDFAAIVVLVLVAIFVSGYILEHQPSFVFGQSYYTVKAPFATAPRSPRVRGRRSRSRACRSARSAASPSRTARRS